ncbi:MAG TPA: DNA adenine methylase [Candidatus Baltobacteraceae bacterium]|nr:DNA adenine methylase [Candidatus Baltobacteraceae bacterium]
MNVASVRQRSPFRYPGGKTWLIPRIRQWFAHFPRRPAALIEPFAGGAIVSLTVAFEQLADGVVMVERDEFVCAVWETILNGTHKILAEKILNFDVTIESVQDELMKSGLSREDRAFLTILRNRVSRGGILAPGSGLMKSGENGKGIGSRWYPKTLYNRIMDIAKISDRVQFFADDGIAFLKRSAHRANVVFFIDPPYTAAGKKAGRRLYTHYELDHEELFDIAATLQGDFLMTYDSSDEIETLAREHGFDTQRIAMKNTHNAEMKELLISRNLDWIRNLD